jgi:MFS family permease
MTVTAHAAPADADRHVARNYALNVGEGVAVITAGVFFSQSAILPLFVARHTDAAWALGLIPAIALLGAQLPQLLGAAAVAKSRHFRATFLVQTALPRLALLVLAFTPLLPPHWALVGFFLFYGLFMAAAGFNAPSWYEFITHVVPARLRGRFFGDRNTVGGVTGLAALGLSGWILGTLPYPYNFSACFLIAAILWMVSYSCMWATRHDWREVDERRKEAPDFLPSAIALLREHAGFRTYVMARWLIAGSVMGAAFYVVNAQHQFHLTTAQSSLLAMALVVLPNLTGVVWGRLCDRFGNRRVQVPTALAAALACWTLLVAPSVGVYAVALFLIGCANVVINISDSKWLTELEPARCGAVVSFFNLALCPASALFSLGAGAIAQVAGMPAVFFLTGLAWLAGALALMAIMLRERKAIPAQGQTA